ncbi:hypothetical protein LINPERHAP1_LOCUS37587 [Linum perenne]
MFCRYRLKTETLLACARNKANRANQTIYHMKGSRPFNVEREVMEKEEGREVSRTELFIRCYEKEPGRSANPATAAFVDSVRGFQADPTTDSGTSRNDAMSRAYRAREKKEKSGRVRHLGFGAKAKRMSVSRVLFFFWVPGIIQPNLSQLGDIWREGPGALGQIYWLISGLGGNAKNVCKSRRMQWKHSYPLLPMMSYVRMMKIKLVTIRYNSVRV